MFYKFKDIIYIVIFILFVIFIIKSDILKGGLAMEAEREAFGIEKTEAQ
ncbi:hypothetical protein [Campylobacter hyointestinalis]|nr:hypothetical protein [Campylobacter hyointestinalis]